MLKRGQLRIKESGKQRRKREKKQRKPRERGKKDKWREIEVYGTK